jgi:NADH-quinone oxidoreductase subunit F
MDEMKILTAFTSNPQQIHITEYEKNGGYQSIRKAIPHLPPEKVIDMVTISWLRGRGGAGFQTGKKWSFIPKNEVPKYLVCNADESEPGTFKDRFLIEHDPHQIIEGIILASYAIGAHFAFIYCRGEFFLGLQRLKNAVQEAKSQGYLGKNILGSDYSLEIIVHPGAGAYIAGDETAQLNSLEGLRATPRLKPPFPASKGLYGMPTVVNNVETLCNVVHIINHGPEWYLNIGKNKNSGTKIFQVSGQVTKPGCYEFPLGVRLKDVLEYAGWMFPGRSFKACYPGGSSCSLLTERDLDVSMDFESLQARGSALGTASIIVMDNESDMVCISHRLMEFYQNESCGKCTPCREGTRWVVQILERILRGKGTESDLPLMNSVCKSIGINSFCGLGIGAAPPILSAIKEFPNEFKEYFLKNPEASSFPPMPKSYPYQNEKLITIGKKT